MNVQRCEPYRDFVGRSPLWTPLHLCHRAIEAYVESQAPRVLDMADRPSARILDVGCGDQPYRKFFDRDPRCGSYEGADIEGATPLANTTIDPVTQIIAAPSDAYDVVVSFQVLEHSLQPLALLRECHRVLRPGGALLLTLPFVYEYHAVPQDFRRWTHEGITEDLKTTGYAGITAEAIETDLHSLIVIGELYLSRYWGYVFTKPLFLTLNAMARALARLKPYHAHRLLPLTLGVTAHKPAAGAGR